MTDLKDKLRRKPPAPVVEMADRAKRRDEIRADLDKLSRDELAGICMRAGATVAADTSRDFLLRTAIAIRMHPPAEDPHPENAADPIHDEEAPVPDAPEPPVVTWPDEEEPDPEPAPEDLEAEAEEQEARENPAEAKPYPGRFTGLTVDQRLDAWHDEQIDAGSSDPFADEAKRRFGTTNKMSDDDIRAEIVSRGGDEPKKGLSRGSLNRQIRKLRRDAAIEAKRAELAGETVIGVVVEPVKKVVEAEAGEDLETGDPVTLEDGVAKKVEPTEPAQEWWDAMELGPREQHCPTGSEAIYSHVWNDQDDAGRQWIREKYEELRAPTTEVPADALDLLERAKSMVRERDEAIDEWTARKEEAGLAKKRVDVLADSLADLFRNADLKQMGLFG